MTNVEKIKEIFPNAEYLECEVVMDVVFARNQENWFDLDWWNAEYKEPTTKNDLGVDKLLSDCEKMSFDIEIFNKPLKVVALDAVKNIVNELPSVIPQEPQSFKWCTDCKEYDQEKHCCHRWSKVIRNTVEEMKQEQEPILDKIRAEIEKEIIPRNSDQYDHEAMWQNCGLRMALKVIDKYKAESEG